jgi:hypothetical protein
MKTAPLLGLAALQLLIIAWVHNPFASATTAEAPWLAELAADALLIEDGEGNTLRLERAEDAWTLPPEGLPVDSGKLERLLSRVEALSPAQPLATSEGAAKRFAVDEAAGFERRVTLTAGGQSQTFLLGRSQGPRHSALRWEEDRAIYRVALTTADWPVTVEGWLDRALLAVPEGDQTTLTVGATVLANADADGNAPVKDGAQGATLRQRLAALRVTRLATDAEQGEAEALENLIVETRDGEALTLRFARLGPEASPTGYLVTSSARPESFYLAPYQGRPLLDAMAALTSPPSP